MAQAPSAKQHDFKQVDQLHKKGKKLAKGGLFSKANPDDAEKAFDEARKLLRKMKPATFESISRLQLVLEDLGDVQAEMSLHNQAGKTMEEAARQSISNDKIDNNGQLKSKAPYFYQQASVHYLAHSQYEKSCKMLVLAANVTVEIGDNSEESIQSAIKLYDQCCAIEENEKRYQMCHEFFDAAVKFCINNNKFAPCCDFLQRQIKQYEYESDKFYQRIYRNICSLMIIQFYLKDVKSAQRIFNEAQLKYQELNNRCNQEQMCERLLLAFETADEERLEAIKKSGDLGLFLMNSVSRFAKKLTMQDIEPLMIIDDNANKNNKVNDQIKDEAKTDVTDAQLESNVADTNVDDQGAPDLLS